MASLTLLDIVVILFLGGGALLGVVRGFVYEVLSLFAWGAVVAARIGYRTRTSVLGPVDRLLGLGFGAVKGLIGATLLFMAGNLVFDLMFGGAAPRPEWVRTARTYPLLQASRRAVGEFVARRQSGERIDGDGGDGGNSTDEARAPI